MRGLVWMLQRIKQAVACLAQRVRNVEDALYEAKNEIHKEIGVDPSEPNKEPGNGDDR